MSFTFVDFVAGCIAGTASLLVGHPMDTMKVREQTMGTPTLQTITQTYKYEGIYGFYKGLLFPLLTFGPVNALFFGVYGNTMRYLQSYESLGADRIDKNDPNLMFNSFLAGCVGGGASVIINCPAEVVKTVRQIETGNSKIFHHDYRPKTKGMWDCVKKIFKDKGIRGFYKGNATLLIRDIPSFGLYTITYDGLEESVYLSQLPSLLKHTITGGTAGVVSWLCILPVDVVKTRLQGDDPHNPKFKGMIHCFQRLYKKHGIKVFFRGAAVLSIRGFIVNACTFVVYEYSIEWLNRFYTDR